MKKILIVFLLLLGACSLNGREVFHAHRCFLYCESRKGVSNISGFGEICQCNNGNWINRAELKKWYDKRN